MKITLITLLAMLFLSCNNSNQVDKDEEFEITIAERCDGTNRDLFENGETLEIVQSPPLDEISGIAASINNPGYYWVHNDSGASPHLYLLDSLGNLVARFKLNHGNRDWEDIACERSPDDGKVYIFVGDFGDNRAVRSSVSIVMIEEPTLDVNQLEFENFLNFSKVLNVEYEDGPKDVETIIVDPLTFDIYLVSKREANSRVFTIEYPYPVGTISPVHIATLPFSWAVAGDISRDGSEILIKDAGKVYYWQREGSENLKHTFKRQAICLPYIAEPQGEAICFSYDNGGYYTISEVKGFEFLDVTLNFFKRK